MLIVLIEREDKTIVPRGSTQIRGNDKLHVMADESTLNQFKMKLLKSVQEA